MAVDNKRSQLGSLIENAWLARHSDPTPQFMGSFLGSVRDVLNDVLSGGEIEFFDFKRENDHESILALSGGQLYTIRVEDHRIRVVFSGSFPVAAAPRRPSSMMMGASLRQPFVTNMRASQTAASPTIFRRTPTRSSPPC